MGWELHKHAPNQLFTRFRIIVEIQNENIIFVVETGVVPTINSDGYKVEIRGMKQCTRDFVHRLLLKRMIISTHN